MNLQELQTFLGWSAVLHFCVLMLWWMMLTLGKEQIFGMHQKMTGLSREELMKLHYTLMGAYKIGAYLFCFVPYLALLIMN